MAFGFGFNKQKVLSAAEKCVQQGKLPNAISEYEKVLKADPKDLTVLNTVGDLHARLGENEKAVECFKNVGDAYAAQGFTVKAIAMYKKLSKLKSSVECVLRLAELYTQQGLFNDARAQYLVVAEEFLHSGQLDQAVRIFQKTLEMDPENVPMRSRLAEVYVRLGKKNEAWQILTAAAETLRAKGQLAAADEILQRMLKLDPGNSYALVLRGRAALEAGDFRATIECLSKVPDLDSNAEGLRGLFKAYLKTQRFQEAATLAIKLANVHDDFAAIHEYADGLIEHQQFAEALQMYERYSDQLLQKDSGKLLESLRSAIGHVKEDPESLQIVLGLFLKAGENTHLTEIYELLAHGYVQSGDLEKAREYYLKLMQLEPDNQMHASNYQQVLEKQVSPNASHLITAEEGGVIVDELEATAPFVDQRHPDEVAMAVGAALTDAELFISYNMPAKALDPLISALPKAPRDLRVNQRLAALHTRAGRFAEAGVCCRTLESVYHDAGYAEEASRYGALATRYEERCTASTHPPDAEIPAELASVQDFEVSLPVEEFSHELVEQTAAPEIPTVAKPVTPPAGLFFHASSPLAPAATEELEVSLEPVQEQAAEIDLSTEWEQDLSVEIPHSLEPTAVSTTDEQIQPVEIELAPAVSENLDEGIEEVRFYLGQGMTDQAEQALVKLEAIGPKAPEVEVLRHAVESAKQHQQLQEPEPEISVTDLSSVEAYEFPSIPSPQPWPHVTPAQESAAPQSIVPEHEVSLGQEFVPEPQDVPATEFPLDASLKPPEFRAGTLDEFVSDLEASLGSDFLPEAAPVVTPEPARPAPAAAETPAPVARAAAASSIASGSPAVASHGSQVSSETFNVSALIPPDPHPATSGSAAGVDLAEMFGELKHELEGDSNSADEDPETHYNLGVAFREMGLLDEALGEFQKVCQSVERGKPFPQLMQAYTWLAQCFLDKGVPEAAVRWYEKALTLPNLDQETRTALHYELASSLESAGNRPAALNNFLEVYGSNIDYRDVGERIRALRP
jgi:tetratricopeptide (TPR) repeat protein